MVRDKLLCTVKEKCPEYVGTPLRLLEMLQHDAGGQSGDSRTVGETEAYCMNLNVLVHSFYVFSFVLKCRK